MPEPVEPGGCRSLFSAGCLIAVAALTLVAAALIGALFLILWLVQFVWFSL